MTEGMEESIDFNALCAESRALVGLTQGDEALLRDVLPLIGPELDKVTERFYARLMSTPSTARFLEGRVDGLRKTHRAWLNTLFNGQFDAEYTRWMHQIGLAHSHVALPVEFMSASMALVQRELTAIVAGTNRLDADMRGRTCAAISSACGFCQLIMERSYANDQRESELERYLRITGVSRTLYEKLSASFKD